MRPRLQGKVAFTTAAGSGMGRAAVLAFANAVKREPCSAAHITVKPDGKYWRVQSVDMGSRRLDVSRVAERDEVAF